jgi:hypothetical protein
MSRYYSEAELQQEVQRQVALALSQREDVRDAVRAQNRSWVYAAAREVASWVLGPTAASFVFQAAEAVWDWLTDWFSG